MNEDEMLEAFALLGRQLASCEKRTKRLQKENKEYKRMQREYDSVWHGRLDDCERARAMAVDGALAAHDRLRVVESQLRAAVENEQVLRAELGRPTSMSER